MKWSPGRVVQLVRAQSSRTKVAGPTRSGRIQKSANACKIKKWKNNQKNEVIFSMKDVLTSCYVKSNVHNSVEYDSHFKVYF